MKHNVSQYKLADVSKNVQQQGNFVPSSFFFVSPFNKSNNLTFDGSGIQFNFKLLQLSN